MKREIYIGLVPRALCLHGTEVGEDDPGIGWLINPIGHI